MHAWNIGEWTKGLTEPKHLSLQEGGVSISTPPFDSQFLPTKSLKRLACMGTLIQLGQVRNLQCFKNWIKSQIEKTIDLRFIGLISDRTAVEPVI